MGIYISDCGNFYTSTLTLTPETSLTSLGLNRKKNVLKIENWWIKQKK